MRDYLHAELAMNIADECGIFSRLRPQTVFLSPAKRADIEDLK
jgi:hypothetical protein